MCQAADFEVYTAAQRSHIHHLPGLWPGAINQQQRVCWLRGLASIPGVSAHKATVHVVQLLGAQQTDLNMMSNDAHQVRVHEQPHLAAG